MKEERLKLYVKEDVDKFASEITEEAKAALVEEAKDDKVAARLFAKRELMVKRNSEGMIVEARILR